jgi:Fe-S oxidoreductase
MLLDIDEYRRQAKMCVRCSFCKYIDMNWIKSVRFAKQCPISTRYAINLYSAHGLLYAAQGEADGTIPFTPKLVDAMYHCTLCGGCDGRCKRNLDCEVLQVIENLRMKYVEQGNPLLPGHRELIDNVNKTKNKYGESQKDRLKWIGEVTPVEKADVLFFVGDNASFRQPELARAVAGILNRTGTPFVVLKDEWSAGNEVLAIGDVKLARELAEHNVNAVKDSGVTTVVTGSAECYKALKVDYPRLLGRSTEEMPYVTIHIAEFADKAVKEGRLVLSKELPIKLTYHDACNLGRLSEPWQHWTPKYDGVIPVDKVWRRGNRGIYDAPRDLLKSIPGVQLLEMERIRGNAWGTGSTGAVEAVFPDFALWTATERLEEAVATGAEAIVTCSPDERQLLGKANESKKAGMKILDLVEVTAQAI